MATLGSAILFAIIFTAIPIIWLGLSLKKDLTESGEKAKLAFGVITQIIIGLPLLLMTLTAGAELGPGPFFLVIAAFIMFACDTIYLYVKADNYSQAYSTFHKFMMVLYVIFFAVIGGAAVYEASHIGSGAAPAAAAAAAVVMNPLGQQEAPAVPEGPPQVFVGVNNPNNSVQVGVAPAPAPAPPPTRGNALLQEAAAAAPANVVVNVTPAPNQA